VILSVPELFGPLVRCLVALPTMVAAMCLTLPVLRRLLLVMVSFENVAARLDFQQLLWFALVVFFGAL